MAESLSAKPPNDGTKPPPEAERADSSTSLPVVTKDALAGNHGEYDIVLAHPPFGKLSSVTIVSETDMHPLLRLTRGHRLSPPCNRYCPAGGKRMDSRGRLAF